MNSSVNLLLFICYFMLFFYRGSLNECEQHKLKVRLIKYERKIAGLSSELAAGLLEQKRSFGGRQKKVHFEMCC